jgi:hypothetical protein
MTSTLAVRSHFLDRYHCYLISTLDIPGQWPAYKHGTKTVLQLIRNNITLIDDGQFMRNHLRYDSIFDLWSMIDWDLKRTNFINTAKVLNEFEK